MHRLSQILERVRTLLFGQPEGRDPVSGSTAEQNRALPLRHPSLEHRAELFALTRRRPSPNRWPADEQSSLEYDPSSGGLVRAYVPSLEECMRVPFTAREAGCP